MMDYIVYGLVALGILFAILRFIIGPNTVNRVVSLDTFNMIVIGLISLLALRFSNQLYLDIAIVYAILAFMETIVYARYVEGHYGNN